MDVAGGFRRTSSSFHPRTQLHAWSDRSDLLREDLWDSHSWCVHQDRALHLLDRGHCLALVHQILPFQSPRGTFLQTPCVSHPAKLSDVGFSEMTKSFRLITSHSSYKEHTCTWVIRSTTDSVWLSNIESLL